jgi:hypothetical protein
VQEKLAAGLGEGEIAELVEDDEVAGDELVGDAGRDRGGGETLLAYMVRNMRDEGIDPDQRDAWPCRSSLPSPPPGSWLQAMSPRGHATASGARRLPQAHPTMPIPMPFKS